MKDPMILILKNMTEQTSSLKSQFLLEYSLLVHIYAPTIWEANLSPSPCLYGGFTLTLPHRRSCKTTLNISFFFQQAACLSLPCPSTHTWGLNLNLASLFVQKLEWRHEHPHPLFVEEEYACSLLSRLKGAPSPTPSHTLVPQTLSYTREETGSAGILPSGIKGRVSKALRYNKVEVSVRIQTQVHPTPSHTIGRG